MTIRIILLTFFLITSCLAGNDSATQDKVEVVRTTDGFRLEVNNQPFFINGMNWDYFPIGTNYEYSLWSRSEDSIRIALDHEMQLLRDMGVNAIRMYSGVPAKWIQYIYEQYGIYTMLNHSFGRYGLSIDGVWIPQTDYSKRKVRRVLLDEVNEMVKRYQQTPGLLLFLLGNENNYGLFWEGAETEDIPQDERQASSDAKCLYRLFNDAAQAIKKHSDLPVAICNGDLQYIELIASECKDIDILGVNAYRGLNFTDLFDQVREICDKPVVLTEFGTDAFNAKEGKEDQAYQANVLISNWRDIYANADGMGKNNNTLGGFTFQFSDGWWKRGQTVELSVHNTQASWANAGYLNDYVPGSNNMNEEWFGICAKGAMNASGTYALYPRAAYYALQQAHQFDPYSSEGSRGLSTLDEISVEQAVEEANNNRSEQD